MKYIICGPAVNQKTEKYLAGVSPAAGRFLNNLIKGLEYNHEKVEKHIYIASPILNEEIYKEILNEADTYYTFKDRYVLKSVIQYRKKLMENVQQGDVVIFYNLFYVYWGLANVLKRKGVKSILLFADYTEAKDEKAMAKKLLAKISMMEFKKFDHVISLANLNESYWNKKAKVMIMRGGINFDFFKGISEPENNEKIRIMYAGLLSEVTGVDILLNAISKVKSQEIEFYISGKGPLENAVKTFSKEDKRVHYLGFLDESAYFEKLNEMHIFINPRNMTLDENKNNFPSKVLEYLATGRVIISTRFSGNEEFGNEIIWYDGTVQELADTIVNTVENYEAIYQSIYSANREAALKYDWNQQAKKIIEFSKRYSECI